jgi:hypothetical protein
MTTDKQRFRIELTGRVPHAIVNEITRRFGPPSVEFLQPVTVMTTATLDQSSPTRPARPPVGRRRRHPLHIAILPPAPKGSTMRFASISPPQIKRASRAGHAGRRAPPLRLRPVLRVSPPTGHADSPDTGRRPNAAQYPPGPRRTRYKPGWVELERCDGTSRTVAMSCRGSAVRCAQQHAGIGWSRHPGDRALETWP